jgi:hypothetical protein
MNLTVSFGLAGDHARRTIDALELAERCVQAWRELLDEYAVDTP